MDPKSLALMCISSINSSKSTGFKPEISLMIPTGNPASKHRYPFGRSGPKGTIVQWGAKDGRDTVIFSAIDVLAYLTAIGVVELSE